MSFVNNKISSRRLSIIVFSLFFAWLLAFPFEGQVLYAISEIYGIKPHSMISSAIIMNALGLLSCGFFIHNIQQAKRAIVFSIILCLLGIIVFFFPPSILWNISIMLSSFFAAISLGVWSYFLKLSTPQGERIKTVADGLIYSNILMIIINAVAVNVSAYLGIGLCMISLFIALFFSLKLPVAEDDEKRTNNIKSSHNVNFSKPLAFLCLFIIIITINSGLMYRVINPRFSHLESLVSWYWAVPYVGAIYIIKNLSPKINRTYILFVAIAMIGFAFVAFLGLDNSAISYLTVNTLMLGACGIYDLFWWSILGEMIDLDNPAKIFGIGLGANVLGVLIGSAIGSTLTLYESQSNNIAILAFTIIFISLILFPPLHKYLSKILKNHIFLSCEALTVTIETDVIKDEEILYPDFTEREDEITRLLLKGRTYKMIADELYLSENTIKTHIKNIYSKLNIKSKSELIKLLSKNQRTSATS